MILFLILVTLPASLSFAQEPAPLGIFDATADWGLGGEFGEKLGEFKVPGRVEVSHDTNGDFVYDLYGNGDDIQNATDEGFYLYTQRTGSWRLSGKIVLLDIGGDGSFLNSYAQSGIMIRETANHPGSVYTSFFNVSKPHTLEKKVRKAQNGYTIGTRLNQPTDPEPLPLGKGYYFRITRYEPLDLFVYEHSENGMDWANHSSNIFPMGNPASFGFVISNIADNDQLAHARISEIKLEPIPVFARRLLTSQNAIIDQPITIVLSIHNPTQTEQKVLIQEQTPDGWVLRSISHNGFIQNQRIDWDIVVQPGDTQIHYVIEPKEHSNGYARFAGSINNQSILGNELIYQSGQPFGEYIFSVSKVLVVLSILAVISVLHLSLYFFHPKNISNLYLTFFFICWFFIIFLTYKFGVNQVSEEWWWAWRFIPAFGFISTSVNILFVYNLLTKKCFDAIRLCIVFVSIILALSCYSLSYPVLIILNPIFLLVGYIESFRLLLIGLIRRIEGLYMIAIGYFIFALSIIKISVQSIVPHVLSDFPLLDSIFNFHSFNEIVFITFMLSLSIYVAFQSARNTTSLEALTDTLENRVQRRTAELEQANEDLRELDKMKSAFVSQASHDLRTPLTSIKSSLDNLVRGVGGGLSERQGTVIGRALNSVNRLTALINDVLDINRIETGRMILEKSLVQMELIVKNTIAENQPFAEAKQITISTSGLDESYPLEVDGGKIERVVNELINNAIKYTPESGSIVVSLSQSDTQVQFAVKDNGIGMSKEDCSKIFERFYRVDAAKTKAKGSGLGLSIAKELVEMHGGSIEVASEFGSGTTFTLLLPKGKQ